MSQSDDLTNDPADDAALLNLQLAFATYFDQARNETTNRGDQTSLATEELTHSPIQSPDQQSREPPTELNTKATNCKAVFGGNVQVSRPDIHQVASGSPVVQKCPNALVLPNSKLYAEKRGQIARRRLWSRALS